MTKNDLMDTTWEITGYTDLDINELFGVKGDKGIFMQDGLKFEVTCLDGRWYCTGEYSY